MHNQRASVPIEIAGETRKAAFQHGLQDICIDATALMKLGFFDADF
jgi:hypothetical protein